MNGTLGATGGTDKNISVSGGGKLVVNGNLSGLNQLQQYSNSTILLNFGVTAGSMFSFDPAGSISFGATTVRGAGAGGSSSGSGRILIVSNGVSVGTASQVVSFRGGNSADSTIGAAIVGGGTGTIHTLAIENATRTGAKYRIAAASNNVLNISSQLRGATSTGSTYWIEGPGIIRLSGTNANPSSAPITVDSGTLELNKTDGVDALSTSVTLRVNAAGTVKWLAGNQIRDDVPLTLAGGTLQVNGCSETASTLQLTAGSTIDFGAGAAALVFANSSALSWGGFALAVQNWTAGSDTLRVGTDSGGLTSSQLSGISFAGYAAGAQIDSQGFVTPIPEPASAALLAGGVAWAWLRRRRAP